MGIFESLKRSKFSIYENEKKSVINTEDIKKNPKLSQDEKLDQILAEIKALCIVVSQHDQHLTMVNNNLQSLVTELMERRKEMPKGKRIEIENIISNAKSRKDAVEKLKTIGISQATSYRYTELFEKEKKKSVIPKKDSSQKKEKNNT